MNFSQAYESYRRQNVMLKNIYGQKMEKWWLGWYGPCKKHTYCLIPTPTIVTITGLPMLVDPRPPNNNFSIIKSFNCYGKYLSPFVALGSGVDFAYLFLSSCSKDFKQR